MNNAHPESVLLRPQDDGLPMSAWGRWAKDKLDVLARYIETSTIAMASPKMHWRRRFYIDLQAGPGKNYVRGHPDDVFLGSPLLALTKGAGYTDYRFVEEDEELVEALQRRCSAFAPDSSQTVRVLAGNCNEIVDDIVKEVNQIDRPPFSRTDWNSLCLVFLDSEGLELNWETVLKVASLKRADLLINFSTGGLRRTARQAYKLPPGEARADKFFGTTEWRDIPLGPRGSMPVYEWIAFYQKRLTEQAQYQWGTPQSVKNSRGVELYRVLFASKDNLGIKLWEDARTKGPSQRLLF
ncbi:MAG: three-Cys-motif partner protein TcmP [Chloroflexota bacterium]|jgi:three-Cys-motif partner protein